MSYIFVLNKLTNKILETFLTWSALLHLSLAKSVFIPGQTTNTEEREPRGFKLFQTNQLIKVKYTHFFLYSFLMLAFTFKAT